MHLFLFHPIICLSPSCGVSVFCVAWSHRQFVCRLHASLVNETSTRVFNLNKEKTEQTKVIIVRYFRIYALINCTTKWPGKQSSNIRNKYHHQAISGRLVFSFWRKCSPHMCVHIHAALSLWPCKTEWMRNNNSEERLRQWTPWRFKVTESDKCGHRKCKSWHSLREWQFLLMETGNIT